MKLNKTDKVILLLIYTLAIMLIAANLERREIRKRTNSYLREKYEECLDSTSAYIYRKYGEYLPDTYWESDVYQNIYDMYAE